MDATGQFHQKALVRLERDPVTNRSVTKHEEKAACDDWTKIPVHCAECGAQFLRKVRHQKYCDEHRYLAGAVIRPQEVLTSNEKSPRPSDERNGCFLDKMGCCKVCDGEIPDGHTDYCDIWKMENDRNRLQADLDWIARMGVSIKTLPDGQRAVVDELRASDETSALEVCVSVNVDGTGNWFPAERLERPDVLVRLDDGTIGVWPIERVRTVGSAEETPRKRLRDSEAAFNLGVLPTECRQP